MPKLRKNSKLIVKNILFPHIFCNIILPANCLFFAIFQKMANFAKEF
jgi:hypothetical protein